MAPRADTCVPEPPYCTYGLRVPASCVPYVPAAQGSWCATVRTPYAYQPRARRTYRVPCVVHHRWRDAYNASRTPAQLKREGKVVSVALTEQLAHEYRRFRADQPSWIPLQPPAAVRAVAMVEADEEPEAEAAGGGGGGGGGGGMVPPWKGSASLCHASLG